MADPHITRLLEAAGQDPAAAQRLYEAVYAELHAIAGAYMRREPAGHTLQATALVNEAYLRLLPAETKWTDRRHFYATAAQAMRRILVDHARRGKAAKRGDGALHVTLGDAELTPASDEMDHEALDEALRQLGQEEPRLEQVVTMRFFAGLDIEQTAAALGISPATVKRDWNFARAWLYDRLHGGS